MKLKRIFILTLTFAFLVSTTGLPLFYHYCEMMGKKSLTECEMCKLETEEIKETSCCSEPIPESKLLITDSESKCCIDEFDYKKIEDNFSQSHQTLITSFSTAVSGINITAADNESEKKYSNSFNYDLPPPQFGKQLLKTIHQLKIDLPVC
ncbi:MAG: hypothetical protein IPM14_08140 [bacterium]|nr:hypothetical protein [bacterium]